MSFKSILIFLASLGIFNANANLETFPKKIEKPNAGEIDTQKSRLRAKIPFENRNGSIILSVKINSYTRPLRLLFDTGADGMAISERLADEIGLKITRENNASVVGGNYNIKVSDNNTIQLDSLTLMGMGIAIFPQTGNDQTDGIIGNTLIRNFITEIDYDNNTLSLYDFGEFEYHQKGTSIPIASQKGVILLKGQLEIIEGKSYNGNFVFDTGASYDLICFRPFVRRNQLLISGFKPEHQGTTISLGLSSPTFSGQSFRFSLPPLSPINNLQVSLMGGNIENEHWSPEVDGSIGVRLLSRYNLTINIAKNEIFFCPNKLHDLPKDFIIKDYLFGWDNNGILKVLQYFGDQNGGHSLKENSQLLQIDGKSVEQLKRQPKLIDVIRRKALESSIEIQLANNKFKI